MNSKQLADSSSGVRTIHSSASTPPEGKNAFQREESPEGDGAYHSLAFSGKLTSSKLALLEKFVGGARLASGIKQLFQAEDRRALEPCANFTPTIVERVEEQPGGQLFVCSHSQRWPLGTADMSLAKRRAKTLLAWSEGDRWADEWNRRVCDGAMPDVRRYVATGVACVQRLHCDDPARDGLLYFRKKFRGRAYVRALATKDLDEASRRAKVVSGDIEAGRWHEIEDRKLRRNWATLAEVCARYEEVATIKTKMRNVWALRFVLKTAGFNPDTCSTSELTAQAVAAFQLARTKATAGNPLREAKAAHGTNSILRQARSVFAAEVRQHYRSLLLPDLGEFMKAPNVDEPRVQYLDPPAAVIQRIGKEYPNLKRADPSAYAAFLLGAFVGLRNNEAVAARWDWIENDGDGNPRLRLTTQSDWTTKTGCGRMVPVDRVVVAELESVRGARCVGGRRSDREYLIPAPSFSARSTGTFFRLNRWLRANGFDREHYAKAFYMLRKHFGRVTAWERGGSYYAARALGNDPQIAAQFYDSTLNTAPLAIPLPANKSKRRKQVLAKNRGRKTEPKTGAPKQ